MAIERPTFHESWSRVGELRPRLRACVENHRQHFRGQLWHVLQDPSNNQFFRVNENAARFVNMLDGRRTVGEVWRQCNERFGDDAPTQGEVIQLLGQLYNANLLYADAQGDVEVMFRRQRKRIAREVRSYLMHLLFIRIPLLDPDRFLNRWVGIFGWLFSGVGLILWLGLLLAGGWVLAGRTGELFESAGGVLAPDNLPLLYISFALIKLLHELGHGFACKRFGRLNGSGGEVHTLGIMLLVFMPVPYVDASSSWAFRSKWQRAVVGAAGIFVEMALAAVAVIVWANTTQGTVVNALAYNTIFVAGVSTLLFNGNPLLRYDGYYILSDLLEIPNLHQRSRDYIYYLVKRYAWGHKRAISSAHSLGERPWLAFYAIASFIYRTIIYVAIILFIADQLIFIGMLLAIAAIFTWIFVPLGKFLRFVATNAEIERVRPRAAWTSFAAFAVIAVSLGMIPMPDRIRAEGVVEPVDLLIVHMPADGFIQSSLVTGAEVTANSAPIITAGNPELEATIAEAIARREGLHVHRRLVQQEDVAMAQIIGEQITALDEQILRLRSDLESLQLRPGISGVWVSPDLEGLQGAFIRRGEPLGLIAGHGGVIIRAVAKQDVAALLREEASDRVQLRVRGRPHAFAFGTVLQYLEAGQDELPAASLGYAVGGSVAVDLSDASGARAAEQFFEVRIRPDPELEVYAGQRIIARFDLPHRPLISQWWRSLQQLVQRRFRI